MATWKPLRDVGIYLNVSSNVGRRLIGKEIFYTLLKLSR